MSYDIHPLSEVLLIITGAFLLFDAIFLKALTFDYSVLGLQSIDPLISHGGIGFVFIIIGVYELYSHK